MEIRQEIKAEPKVVRAGSLALQQMGEGAQRASAYWGPAVPGREMDVPGASSQTLTGEIGLSEFQNVFAEVSICPETMELLQKSLREAHFEATVTCFEFPWQIGWKSRAPQFSLFRAQRIPFGEPGCQGRFPGSTKVSQDRTETRIKLKVLGGLVARSGAFFAPPEKFTFMAGPRER